MLQYCILTRTVIRIVHMHVCMWNSVNLKHYAAYICKMRQILHVELICVPSLPCDGMYEDLTVFLFPAFQKEQNEKL